MPVCPKCGRDFTPLKIHFHKMQCDGQSTLIKGTRPGRVSSKSVRISGAVVRRGRALEYQFISELSSAK